MAALTLDTLLRSLKKSPQSLAPVYVLYGEEDMLKQEAVRALTEAVLGKTQDFNFDTRFASDLTPETFSDLVNTLPMFTERRLVIIRAMDYVGKRKSKLRDEIIRYLAAPSPSTVMVLVFPADEDPDDDYLKGTTAVKLDPLDTDRVPRWVGHYAATLGLALEPEAVELLLSAVGTDLSTVARELEKLASLAVDRAATAQDVTALVGVRRGETVYDLLEAALERRAARAAQLVGPVLEQAGMTGVKILSLLGTHLVGMAIACIERDRGSRRPEDAVFRRMLAVRPYGLRNYKEEAARWVKWSAHWRTAELGGALREALQADYALKNASVSDDWGIVTQLLLGFAKLKREAA
jgi:DNA polymerase III subunit delta